MTPSIPLPQIAAQQIRQIADLASQIEASAPFIFLLPGQLQAQGGTLFPGAERVVWMVAHLLLDRGRLFPGCTEDGADLLRCHNNVADLRALLTRLQGLCDAARDTIVALQASNLRRALLVLSIARQHDESVAAQAQVRNIPPTPAQLAQILERKTALVRVYSVIDGYYQSLQQRKAQRKAAQQPAQPAQPAPPTPLAMPPQPHPTTPIQPAPLAMHPQPRPTRALNPAVATESPALAGGFHAAPAAPPATYPTAPSAAPAAAPAAPTLKQRAQQRAQAQRKDASRLEALEEFEDQLRGTAPPATGLTPAKATPPLAFSAHGMRRYAVRNGDRSALKPARRSPPSAFAHQQQRLADLYLSAQSSSLNSAAADDVAAVPHHPRE